MLFKKPKVGIALAGGGAKGLAHIGVLEVFEKEGIPIDIIAGTSIGAIVGGFYALKPDAVKMKNMARRFVDSEAYREMRLSKFKSEEEDNWFERIRHRLKVGLTFVEALGKSSLIPEEPVEEIFDEMFNNKTFKDMKLPFASVALDLVSGQDIIFKEGLIKCAVRASAAIPGIFPAVKLGGRILVDGGVTANVPVEAARDLGADIVIGVIFGYKPSPPGKLNSSMSVILRGDELAKLKLFRLLLEEADYVIEIDTKDVHWTDFGRLDECVEMGRTAAYKHIDVLKKITQGGIFSRLFFPKKTPISTH